MYLFQVYFDFDLYVLLYLDLVEEWGIYYMSVRIVVRSKVLGE